MPRNIADVSPEALALGQTLLAARLEVEKSQDEIAKKIGRSPNCVCQWEKGYRSPQIADLPAIAKALGMSTIGLCRRIFAEMNARKESA